MINDLFCDLRYQYLFGDFFMDDDVMIKMGAELLIIDAQEEADARRMKFS